MVTVGVGVLCLMLGLMVGYEVAYYRQIRRSKSTVEMLETIDKKYLSLDEENKDGWN